MKDELQTRQLNNKLRIGVIFGGRSGEHEISLLSARSILNALDRQKYDIIQIGISKTGRWYTGEDVITAMESGHLAYLTPVVLLPEPGRGGFYPLGVSGIEDRVLDVDVIFPVLHGTFGEDGTLQGMLEMAELAYVGPGVLGAAVAMDKVLFKAVMIAHGIPVLPHRLVLKGMLAIDTEGVINSLETLSAYPLFTKPANLGSSVGISKCRNRSDLLEGLLDAAQYDRRILVERGLAQVREIEVSVLGNDEPVASIPGEIIPAADFYSYEAKYQDDRSSLRIPAPLSEEMTAHVMDLAVRAYRAIDCAGLARVDFLLDTNTETLYLNEINTIPGFTQISMYPKLWEASGLPYPGLLDKLIELALERHDVRTATVREFRT